MVGEYRKEHICLDETPINWDSLLLHICILRRIVLFREKIVLFSSSN